MRGRTGRTAAGTPVGSARCTASRSGVRGSCTGSRAKSPARAPVPRRDGTGCRSAPWRSAARPPAVSAPRRTLRIRRLNGWCRGSFTGQVMSPSATPLRSARPRALPRRVGSRRALTTSCRRAPGWNRTPLPPRRGGFSRNERWLAFRPAFSSLAPVDATHAWLGSLPRMEREERDVLPVADGVLVSSGAGTESGTCSSPTCGGELGAANV